MFLVTNKLQDLLTINSLEIFRSQLLQVLIIIAKKSNYKSKTSMNEANYRSNNFSVIQHQPYFKISEVTERSKNYLRFQFLSIAKTNINPLDIYKIYFWDLYSKAYYRQQSMKRKTQRVQKQHVSIFLLVFIEIFILKRMTQHQQKPNTLITSIINDLVKYNDKNQQQSKLSQFIRNYASELYQEKLKMFKTQKQEYYFQNSLKIQQKIQQIINNVNYLIQGQQFTNLKRKEFLPSRLNDKVVKRIIQQNFRVIKNIKVLAKSLLRQFFESFYKINKHHFDTKVSFDQNYIILPKYSKQTFPIAAQLQNILKKLHQLQQKSVFEQISRQIFLFCFTYNTNTKHFYPKISIKDTIFDQKSLNSFISYSTLLLDAIGLQQDTKNFELKLSTQPTPNCIDYESSHLEFLIENKIILDKKYYYPSNNLENLNQSYENSSIVDLDIKCNTLGQKIHVWRLLQIIYYIYHQNFFINDYYNGKFNSSSQQNQLKKPISFSFKRYICQLQKAFNQIQNRQIELVQIAPLASIQNNSNQQRKTFDFTLQSLNKYFNINIDDDSLIQNAKSYSFKNYLYCRNNLCKEIINHIVHQSFCKGVLNPKKYLIIYFVGIMEEVNFLIQIREKQRQMEKCQKSTYSFNDNRFSKKHNISRHIQVQLQKQINKVNIKEQMNSRKAINRDVYDKIIEYPSRNDTNGIFVKDNPKYFHKVIEYQRQIAQITKWIHIQEQIIQRDENNIQQLQKLKDFSKYMDQQSQIQESLKRLNLLFETRKNKQIDSNQVKQAIKSSINEFWEIIYKIINRRLNLLYKQANKSLKDCFKQYLVDNILEYQLAHKVFDLMNHQQKRQYANNRRLSPRIIELSKWYQAKLTALVETVCQLNISTFKRYELIFKNILIEQESKGIRKKPDQAEFRFVQTQRQKMQQIINFYQDNKVQGIVRQSFQHSHKIKLINNKNF